MLLVHLVQQVARESRGQAAHRGPVVLKAEPESLALPVPQEAVQRGLPVLVAQLVAVQQALVEQAEARA